MFQQKIYLIIILLRIKSRFKIDNKNPNLKLKCAIFVLINLQKFKDFSSTSSVCKNGFLIQKWKKNWFILLVFTSSARLKIFNISHSILIRSSCLSIRQFSHVRVKNIKQLWWGSSLLVKDVLYKISQSHDKMKQSSSVLQLWFFLLLISACVQLRIRVDHDEYSTKIRRQTYATWVSSAAKQKGEHSLLIQERWNWNVTRSTKIMRFSRDMTQYFSFK